MRYIGFIVFLLLSFGFSGKAQVREDYAVQPTWADLSKMVQIYPNPAVDFIHIRIDQLPARNIQLSLHNIIGNEMNVETEKVDDHELRVRVKDLAAGYYLLALKDEENNFRGTFKFLKR